MAKFSRRGVLILTAAGVGEVGALAASAALGAHFAPTASATAKKSVSANPDMSQGPLAAIVTDIKAGTIIIMRGETETTITDPALVHALLSY